MVQRVERFNMKFSSITYPATLFITVVATSAASAQLQDSYLSDGNGTIFHLDSDTLVATEVGQMQIGNLFTDMEYLGDGRIVVNSAFAMMSYDLNTSTQTTLFTSQEVQSEPSGVSLLSGLTLQSDGDLYFTSLLHGPSGRHFAGATYDPNTESIDLLAGSPFPYLYLDHHEISPGRMLGTESETRTIDIFDPSTGIVETSYTLDLEVYSFVEFDDVLFVLTSGNHLYTFDHTSGATEFYGTITGTSDALLGITVPTPSSAVAAGLAAMMYTRRRR